MNNRYLKTTGTTIAFVIARLRFVVVFVIAALVIGYWDDITNHVDKWTRPAVAPDSLASSHAGDVEYYCPMHPDVVRGEPGNCPKCGMPLAKRKRGEAITLPADVLARVQLTPQRIELAGVQTTAVEYQNLSRQIKAIGVLDYDETRLARLSARMAGRADELFVTFTGQSVRRGDAVYSLYSPDVYTSLREYLLARKRVNELPKSAGEDTKTDASAVYNASLQRLVLWGITTEQLDAIDHDFDETGRVPTHLTITSPISGIVVAKDIAQGQYLQVGESPYTVADLGTLWLQLKLYELDVPLVEAGDAVEVTVDAMPAERFPGVVAFKSFQIDPQTRTLDARVVVENRDLRLRPGMLANAVISVPVTARRGIATTQANGSATAPASVDSPAATYFAALQPYLKAHQLLSTDKSDGVAALIRETVQKLTPIKDAPDVAPGYQRLSAAVSGIKEESLPSLRNTWLEVSAAMIEIGKAVGVPPDAPAVRVFRCPMKKANWIQLSDATENPYYGAEMYSCGSAVESLPKAPAPAPVIPAKTQATAAPSGAQRMLAVPRSAVIHTGEREVVYVESSPGIFDMRAVTLAPAAADQYPVLTGLDEGDRVVTRGAFLIDAENRLNPSAKEPQMNTDEHR